MVVFNKKFSEIIVLIAVIYACLFTGIGNVFDATLEHDLPYGYFASDAFWHELYAESILYTGSFKTYAPYMEANIDNVVGSNPPILPHLAVVFKYVTGLELYDAEMLLVFLIPIVASLVFFLLVRRISSLLAILSIPLVLLLFKGKFMITYTWGIWTYLISTMFVIAFAWSFYNINLKKSYLLMGLFLAGTIMGYISNFIYAIGLIAFYFTMLFLFTGKLHISKIKGVTKAVILSLIISVYYLYIFKFALSGTYVKVYTIIKAAEFTGYRIPLITELGWVGLVALAGFLGYLFFTKRKLHIAYIFPIFMFIFSFANYIGFEKRALTIRFFWPIYLSVFFGLVFFLIIKTLNIKHQILIGTLISLSFIAFIGFQDHNNFSGSIMDSYHWEALNWIDKNIEKDKQILYFYSYAFDQTAVLIYGKIPPHTIRADKILPFIQTGTIPRNVTVDVVVEGVARLPYQKKPFSFGFHMTENRELFDGIRDICSYDYILIDKVQREKTLQDYNLMVLRKLVEAGSEPVFNNVISVILRNKHKGGDCIGQINEG
ncbi:MAG: hypothetical protein U9O94_11110 [Nanoarchaeota archaeon]|nr:hypothetical protein [Nanoarchaeota archaeon]